MNVIKKILITTAIFSLFFLFAYIANPPADNEAMQAYGFTSLVGILGIVITLPFLVITLLSRYVKKQHNDQTLLLSLSAVIFFIFLIVFSYLQSTNTLAILN